MSKNEYKELIAFHPGYYIREFIEDMGISQDEFAKRLGTTGKHLSDLINGKINLSSEIANKLSIMFGTSVEVWLNMQKTYTKKILDIENKKAKDKEAECISLIDYSYFVNLGLVPKARTSTAKAGALLKYLKIFSFDVLKEPDFLVNFRAAVDQLNEKNIINSNIWVQTAINIGQSFDTEVFNPRKLNSHIQEIREMTLQEPNVFLPRLREIFASCGIAFVVLPHLKNSGVHGAVKWISKDKVILAINNRRQYADTFWFSLFHEIGHVLQQKRKMLIVCGDFDINNINSQLETEANEFAQSNLIPGDQYSKFISSENFSEIAIKCFAIEINIHPGIVVGRLQKEKHIGFNRFNWLKVKYIVAD